VRSEREAVVPHGYRRLERIDELLKQEIAGIIGELKDPRIGFATVMNVECSPDLRHTRVFVSVLGDEDEKREAIDALRRASGFIRSRVGDSVTLKYLPTLHFDLDRSIEKAARIQEILDTARREEPSGEE
jgi:ribosome-binding factor A